MSLDFLFGFLLGAQSVILCFLGVRAWENRRPPPDDDEETEG